MMQGSVGGARRTLFWRRVRVHRVDRGALAHARLLAFAVGLEPNLIIFFLLLRRCHACHYRYRCCWRYMHARAALCSLYNTAAVGT